jgi:hypothetical protein
MENQPNTQPSTPTKKPMKPVITRVVHFKEESKVSNKRRVVTVKYEFDRLTNTLKYGASIHNGPLNNKEKFDKKGHVETATKRFQERPVTVKNFVSDLDTNLFHKTIRHQLHFYGVRSPKSEPKVFEIKRLSTAKQTKSVKPVTTNSVKPTEDTASVSKKVVDPTLKKEMKPVITQLFNVREVKGNTKRVITIQYKYDRINKKLEYGAAIHKSEVNASDKYDKEAHKATAIARFKEHPVVVENFVDNGEKKLFNKELRGLLHKHGVKSKVQ